MDKNILLKHHLFQYIWMNLLHKYDFQYLFYYIETVLQQLQNFQYQLHSFHY